LFEIPVDQRIFPVGGIRVFNWHAAVGLSVFTGAADVHCWFSFCSFAGMIGMLRRSNSGMHSSVHRTTAICESILSSIAQVIPLQ
jgi:hypothetical protein